MSADDDESDESPSAYRGTRMGRSRANGRARANDSLPRRHFDTEPGRRDLGMWNEHAQPTIWDAVNYPKEEEFEFESYYLRYDRQAEARAIIDKPVDDTWQEDPKIKDEEHEDADNPQSDFEEDVSEFFAGEHTRRKPIHRLNIADKLGRLGQYSLLVLGTADGREMSEPLRKNEFDGLDDLNYLAAFGEDRIIDIHTNSDMTSERFRLPEEFEVITQELEDQNVSDEEYESEVIHHSRVIHIPEGTLEDDLRGTPALKPVFHELLNIDKIKAASGEGYWRAGYQGLLIQPPQDPSGPGRMTFSDDSEGVQNEIRDFLNNFQRTIATRAEVNGLDMSVGDPTAHLKANYEAIAAALDIPKSILTGEDRADTASSEDVRQWHQKVGERRNKFAGPVILEPLITKMVDCGLIAEPEGENFVIDWPPLDEMTEQQEWQLRSTKADVLKKVAPGGMPERLANVPELRSLLGWGVEVGSEVDINDGAEEGEYTVEDGELVEVETPDAGETADGESVMPGGEDSEETDVSNSISIDADELASD